MSDSSSPSISTVGLSGLIGPTLVGIVLGLLAGALVWMLLPKEFETAGTIRLGYIDDRPIEPPGASAQRLRSRSFQDRVAEKLGLDPAASRLFRDGMFVQQVRGSEALLEVRLRGTEPERSRSLFMESVAGLAAATEEIATGEITRRQKMLIEARAELRANLESRAELDRARSDSASGRSADRFAESVVIARTLADRDQQREVLLQRIARLEESLAPTRTYPTSAVEVPPIPDRQAFPRLSAMLAAGLTVGALLGAFWATLRRHRSAVLR
jgi:hypothetical protein